MQAIAAITLAYGFVSTCQFIHCYLAYVASRRARHACAAKRPNSGKTDRIIR
jgi:hypothetical protein